MKGLVMKDLYSLRVYAKQLGFIYLFYIVCAFIGLWDVSFFVGLATMMGAMMVITTFSYDNIAKWDEFALTMPIARRDLVSSKYIVMFLTMLINAVASLCIGIVVQLIQNKLELITLLATCGGVIVAALLGFSIELMVTFKVGVEKARLSLMLIFLIPTVVIVGSSQFIGQPGLSQVFGFLEKNFAFIASIVVAVIIVITIVSYFISIKIVEKREF